MDSLEQNQAGRNLKTKTRLWRNIKRNRNFLSEPNNWMARKTLQRAAEIITLWVNLETVTAEKDPTRENSHQIWSADRLQLAAELRKEK